MNHTDNTAQLAVTPAEAAAARTPFIAKHFQHSLHTLTRSNLPLQNDAMPPASVCPSKAEVIHTSESVKLLLAAHVEEKATEPWKCTNYSDRET